MQPATDAAKDTVEPAVSSYVVDAARSTFTVQAFSTGVLSVFGHNPRIAVRDMQGEVGFAAASGTVEHAHVHIEIGAGSLEVIDDISDKDRREIHRQMREEVLETEHYPKIIFDCSRVSVNGEGDRFSAQLNGELTLHGETHPLSVTARVMLNSGVLKASGEFSVSQREYGIAPVTVAGGAIKLKDEVRCAFNIVARKQG